MRRTRIYCNVFSHLSIFLYLLDALSNNFSLS